MPSYKHHVLARLLLPSALGVLALGYTGCPKTADNASSGAQSGGSAGMSGGLSEEDKAVKSIKAKGVKESVIYAGDAISIDFYGCGRIGKSNNVVCALDLTGSGSDWSFGGCAPVTPTAQDENGMDYRGTATLANFMFSGSWCPSKDLVEGVRTEARLHFDGVNSGATSFARLQWDADAKNTQADPPSETLTFRDITLQ